ncbi:hypothetical protein HU200_067078 [Digitaria exilis]|uniref:Uncharacterized protein n=1 Tax=Digitaria exilis TaxID=1010633 RepID=A0A835A5K4_9POAL|nr:hypothetical protein HU200_067078 [Digitaria exilis]
MVSSLQPSCAKKQTHRATVSSLMKCKYLASPGTEISSLCLAIAFYFSQLGDFGLAKWNVGNSLIRTSILGQSGSAQSLLH